MVEGGHKQQPVLSVAVDAIAAHLLLAGDHGGFLNC